MKTDQTSQKIWKYPDSFKLKAVKLSLQKGAVVKDVATMLEIHPVLLSKWRKDYREGRISDNAHYQVTTIQEEKQSLDRIAALEKEVTRLRSENRILRAMAAGLQGDGRMQQSC